MPKNKTSPPASASSPAKNAETASLSTTTSSPRSNPGLKLNLPSLDQRVQANTEKNSSPGGSSSSRTAGVEQQAATPRSPRRSARSSTSGNDDLSPETPRTPKLHMIQELNRNINNGSSKGSVDSADGYVTPNFPVRSQSPAAPGDEDAELLMFHDSIEGDHYGSSISSGRGPPPPPARQMQELQHDESLIITPPGSAQSLSGMAATTSNHHISRKNSQILTADDLHVEFQADRNSSKNKQSFLKSQALRGETLHGEEETVQLQQPSVLISSSGAETFSTGATGAAAAKNNKPMIQGKGKNSSQIVGTTALPSSAPALGRRTTAAGPQYQGDNENSRFSDISLSSRDSNTRQTATEQVDAVDATNLLLKNAGMKLALPVSNNGGKNNKTSKDTLKVLAKHQESSSPRSPRGRTPAAGTTSSTQKVSGGGPAFFATGESLQQYVNPLDTARTEWLDSAANTPRDEGHLAGRTMVPNTTSGDSTSFISKQLLESALPRNPPFYNDFLEYAREDREQQD